MNRITPPYYLDIATRYHYLDAPYVVCYNYASRIWDLIDNSTGVVVLSDSPEQIIAHYRQIREN